MNSSGSIAVVSMACRFPDAASPEALWQNVLDGRRSFRIIPPERLQMADYGAGAIEAPLSITPVLAGLVTDWNFDRSRFRVSKSAFEAADLAHWMALDTAEDALKRLGGRDRFSKLRTAVILGNTLTGEFSRTSQIPLRLPYLLSKARAVLEEQKLPDDTITGTLDRLRQQILADFPAPDEDMLAGGLANTIAGRIANHFDFRGGAWTVDGACASSLLAIIDACTRLKEGSVDVVLAGGVDLSLDPFELVGFSRNGALASDVMRVFDRRSNGFWPGEGCGIVILANKRALGELAVEPLAYLPGWGVSTDGAGGLTRPTSAGQYAAQQQAYRRAAIDPSELGYVEAHGTGTAVGDPVEIRALAELVGSSNRPVSVGSIKANIGHTKAAAGIAGLIKVVSAMQHNIIPPHVGCDDPHPVFSETGNRIAPSLDPVPWPRQDRRYAGVSGFGFGGVNTHVVVAGAPPTSGGHAQPRPMATQDAELFLFSAETPQALSGDLAAVRDAAGAMSLSAVADAAVLQSLNCDMAAPCRAAFVVSRPDELVRKLDAAIAKLADGKIPDQPGHEFEVSMPHRRPRIGYLFPGQAAPVRTGGGIWKRRFPVSRALLAELPPDAQDNDVSTEIAQPAITASSCAAIEVLSRFGIAAEVAVGHSLGEIAALSWAGALTGHEAVRLARQRGQVMATSGKHGGSMARIACSADDAAAIAAEFGLAIACENASDETVLAGDAEDVNRCVDRLRQASIDASRLAVSHAFHTAFMKPATAPFSKILDTVDFAQLGGTVISTVAGHRLEPDQDLKKLLLDQLVAPVRFLGALAAAARDCDFLIEPGSGSGLTRLARQAGHQAISIDSHGHSLRGLLDAVALAFLSGARIDPAPLLDGRRLRAFDPSYRPVLLSNPCGAAAWDVVGRTGAESRRPLTIPPRETQPEPISAVVPPPAAAPPKPGGADRPMLDTVLSRVADELALPIESLSPGLHFLDDLHLNSLAVGRIVGEVSRQAGLEPPASLSDFANASLGELADALTELKTLGKSARQKVDRFEGVAPWIEQFRFDWKQTSPPCGSQDIAWQLVEPGQAGAAALRLSPDDGSPGAVIRADGRCAREALQRIWQTTRACLEAGIRHVAFVHAGAPVSAFARSLHEEKTFDTILVVECPTAELERARVLLDTAEPGFSEWRIDRNGTCWRPVFRQVKPTAGSKPVSWDGDDVVVVTGGARGIGAECALRLSEKTGARLLLLGRSPADHDDVADTLTRCEALGADAIYRSVDVTRADQVAATFREAAVHFRHPVTGIIHAAGINQPQRFSDITPESLEATLAVKVTGLDVLLGLADRSKLKLVVGFGSIIGRLGLAGETHYALANAAQSALLEEFASENSHIHVAAPEWSVWAGAGMGERLGTLERLSETGVEALSMDGALDAFEKLVVTGELALDGPCTSVLTGRFGPPETVELELPEIPINRFLETVRVHYPGIEIVADTQVSRGTDPYLKEHVIDDQAVLPGVMILEAMAEVAEILAPSSGQTGLPPDITFEAIRFDRPVVVPDHSGLTLRIAALRSRDRKISCVVKTSADGFAAIHASGTITFGSAAMREKALTFDRPEQPTVSAAGFYGPLFFNRGRFETVRAYRRLSAFGITADLRSARSEPWFGSFLPQALRLDDPGIRDGGLHALQVCVPQLRVVPASVERISIRDPQSPRRSINARQVRASADTFVFDITFHDENGRCVEIWEETLFRSVGPVDITVLPDHLFACWLERELALATGRDDVRVARSNGADQEQRRDSAVAACGLPAITHRSDGRPLLSNGCDGIGISVSHHADSTLVIAARGAVGCDLEGESKRLPPSFSGDMRHWSVSEALRKCGLAAPSWLTETPGRNGAVTREDPLRTAATVAGHAVIACRWRNALNVAVVLGPQDTTPEGSIAGNGALRPASTARQNTAQPLNEPLS